MKAIDPKYGIDIRNGEPVLVKMSSGEPIPDDEPIMIFRARDRNALPGALMNYYDQCLKDGCIDLHMGGIANRINAFKEFATRNPARMKQPGITRGL